MLLNLSQSSLTFFYPEYIRCEFEEGQDFCHWEVKPSEVKPDFAWTRITAEGVEVLGVEGPPFDHDEHRDKFFVYISASKAQEGRSLAADVGPTILKSPYLISLEHPEECLEFWFYIKVISCVVEHRFRLNWKAILVFFCCNVKHTIIVKLHTSHKNYNLLPFIVKNEL